MRLKLLKGCIIGILLLGSVCFLKECYPVALDTLAHIPDILCEGYQSEALSPEFTGKFISWLIAETLLVMLLPEAKGE